MKELFIRNGALNPIADYNSQGNVLFLILVALALFAALSYTISQSNRAGKTDISSEKAQLAAGVNDQCTAGINTAIARLSVVRGCASDQISYELPDGTNLNPKAPTNKSCHIFNPAGGGVVPCGQYAMGGLPCIEELTTIGASCAGIVYAGIYNGKRIYTTASDQGSACWGRCTTLWIVANGSDASNGTANTDKMVTAAINVALSCRALGEKWYLPSLNESLILYTNRIAIGGFSGDAYWTSTERPTDSARTRNMTDGSGPLFNKNVSKPYRCIRMD